MSAKPAKSRKDPRETNVEIITRIMEQSRYGALSQAFVIEALTRYANECAAMAPEYFQSALLSGKAWHGVAVEIKAILDKQYN